MKLAFDKLNQHQIIIQKRNKTSYVYTFRNHRLHVRFISSLFASLTIYEDEDELWIKFPLIALFRNVSIP